MKRECFIYRSSPDHKKNICIDIGNYESIIKYIERDERHKKKINHIFELILTNKRNSELYDKEDIDRSCKGVTAMKLFKGQENDRIYCKEFKNESGTFYVVAAEIYEKKKSIKLTNKQKNIIRKISQYEYEIISFKENERGS